MKRRNGLRHIAWVLLPVLFAALIGLTPRALDLDRDLSRAHNALEAGNAAAASEFFGKILERQPWRSSLWETAGRTALAAGDSGTAIERLLKAESAGKITAEGYLALGDAYRAQEEWSEAVANWNRALDLGIEKIPVYQRLLEVHRRLGDYTAAIDDLQALAALDPEDAGTHYQLGLLLAAREPEIALSSLLRASSLDSGLTSAVRLLEQSLEPHPEIEDPAFTFFNAGRALASLEEWTLAAEAFRQALLANPAYAEAWAFLGESMYHLGLDGREMLETGIEVDPESLTAHLLFAINLRREGNPALALEYLEKAAVIAPGAAVVAAETAQTYAALGQINAALELFTRAVELAPDDPAYLHLLAMYSIYNELQIEQVGLPAARAAVLKNPGDPVALDLIGYAYYVQGDWVSGLRFLHRSLTANPNYAPARLHLGMLLLAQEDKQTALTQFRSAIRLSPGSPAAEQAQSIIELYFP